MDINAALQEAVKTALIHAGLACGICKAAETLDKHQAYLCVLASNCDKPMYVKLMEALYAEHQINLIKVDDNKKLGEWVRLYKIVREGKPHKWLVVIVWWLRTTAESLRPRMTLGNTSNARNEQIKNLVLVPKKKKEKRALTWNKGSRFKS